MAKKENPLTKKQDGFAWDIANKTYDYDWEAYAAHYDTKKMSQNAIYVEACRLRSNPKISLRIKAIEKKIRDEEKVTLDEIIIKLSQRVNMDIREMYNDDGTFKNIKDLTQEQAMFLTGIDTQEIWGKEGKESVQIGVVKKVKIESIKDMLDMLIRHYGGYAKDKDFDKSEISEIKELISGLNVKQDK